MQRSYAKEIVLAFAVIIGYYFYRSGRERSLAEAVRSADVRKVDELLASGVSPNVVEATPPPTPSMEATRRSLLDIALETKHPEIAYKLLEKGAKPDTQTERFLAKIDAPEVTLYLIEHGGDKHKTLEAALEGANSQSVEAILKKYPELKSDAATSMWLTVAATKNSPEMIDLILSLGVAIDDSDVNGNTPLMMAAMQGAGEGVNADGRGLSVCSRAVIKR